MTTKILTICGHESIAQVTIAQFIIDSGFTKFVTTPPRLTSNQLANCDCTIYIDKLPQPEVILRLEESLRPSILVAEQNFQGNQCLFIPLGVLEQPNSASIGIDVIRHHLVELQLGVNGNNGDFSQPESQIFNPSGSQRASPIQ